jgi:hypothetical protein
MQDQENVTLGVQMMYNKEKDAVILDLRNATNHVKIQNSLMSTLPIVIYVIATKNKPKLV